MTELARLALHAIEARNAIWEAMQGAILAALPVTLLIVAIWYTALVARAGRRRARSLKRLGKSPK